MPSILTVSETIQPTDHDARLGVIYLSPPQAFAAEAKKRFEFVVLPDAFSGLSIRVSFWKNQIGLYCMGLTAGSIDVDSGPVHLHERYRANVKLLDDVPIPGGRRFSGEVAFHIDSGSTLVTKFHGDMRLENDGAPDSFRPVSADIIWEGPFLFDKSK